MFYTDNICEYYRKSKAYGFELLEGKDFQAIKGPYKMPFMSLAFGNSANKNLIEINSFLAGEEYCWFVNQDEAHVSEDLINRGFRKDEMDPVMVLNLKDHTQNRTTHVDIKIVRNEGMLDEWAHVASLAYEMEKEGFRRFAMPAAKENREDIRAFIGYDQQGKAIATSMVHISHKVAAIYWISVLKEYRRQSIGADMTKICIEHAKQQNTIKQICLQSFPDGVSLYQKLGFKVVNSVTHYWPPVK